MARKCLEELKILLKAKTDTCIWVNTFETGRFLADLIEILHLDTSEENNPNALWLWNLSQGLMQYSVETKQFVALQTSEYEEDQDVAAQTTDPAFMLQYITSLQSLPLKNAPVFVIENIQMLTNSPKVIQALLDIKKVPRLNNIPVLVLSSQRAAVPEWNKAFTLFDYELPDEEEIKKVIQIYQKTIQENTKEIIPEEQIQNLITAAKGLTYSELDNACRKSIVKYKTLDQHFIKQEKINIIKNSGCLDYRELDDVSIDDMGGYDNFKNWLLEIKMLLTPEAQKFGLPRPKGAISFGVAGAGKSFGAEIAAKLFGLPLIELNFGKILGSLVGQSERTIDKALATIKAVAPCVVLLDETEKTLGGYQGSIGGNDSGTLSRVLGRLLEFMNDNKSGVFFMLTSNDITRLPPELLRTGRLDTQWYFGLPNTAERKSIFDIYIKKSGHTLPDELKDYAVDISKNFTGSEIASMVNIMLRKLWLRYKKDNSVTEYTKQDIEQAAKEIVPVYRSAADTVTSLQNYAKKKARFASAKEVQNMEILDTIDISI